MLVYRDIVRHTVDRDLLKKRSHAIEWYTTSLSRPRTLEKHRILLYKNIQKRVWLASRKT